MNSKQDILKSIRLLLFLAIATIVLGIAVFGALLDSTLEPNDLAFWAVAAIGVIVLLCGIILFSTIRKIKNDFLDEVKNEI